MIEFIFMLTHHDRTVPNAEEVLGRAARDRPALRGLQGRRRHARAAARPRRPCARRRAARSCSRWSRPAGTRAGSVRAAVDAGVDWVLGGTHAAEAAALLAGTGIRYCPFPGTIVGHPSVLQGEIDEIARSAAELTALDGVHGVDLLAYRHPTADRRRAHRRGRRRVVRAGDRGRLRRRRRRRSALSPPPGPGASPSAARSSRAGCPAARTSPRRCAPCSPSRRRAEGVRREGCPGRAAQH